MRIVLLLALLYSSFSDAEEPQLQSGDIIFQTSGSKQSYAIMWASKSLYGHVGVVEVDGKDRYVIEAISKVSRTPLKKWIQRVKELDVDNAVVRKLVEKRWRKHPVCKTVKSFEDCWGRMLEDTLITPESIAADGRLLKVWSNYPL